MSPRTLDRVKDRRHVVDYALQRRALLADLYAGRASATDVCDAHPYLQRAAKYHGEQSEAPCPACRKARLVHVNYVYGDQLKAINGQAKTIAELQTMVVDYAEFRVYTVEVCRACGWNHLTTSFVLGRGGLAGSTPATSRREAARE